MSLSSISLLTDQRFQVGVPPFASNETSQNILKKPSNVTLTLWLSIFSKFDSIVVSSLRPLTCFFLVLTLEIFISKKSKPSIDASKT